MKILIDARFYGLENAGLGRYTMNLLKELAAIDKNNKYIILLRKKYFNSLNLPDGWKSVLADFRHYSLAEQIKLPRIIYSEKPDLVHFLHFNSPGFFRGKFVVTIHDLIMHKQGRNASTLPLPLYLAKRLFYKYIFRHSVKSSVKIIVPSKFVKSQICQYYGTEEQKIIVAYEGLEEKMLSNVSYEGVREKYKLDSAYFIYAGNTYPYKNLERVIEATVFLNQSLKKKVLFAIVSGRGVFLQRLEKSVAKLNAGKYVKLLGFVPDADLGALYKGSVAFVYPSLSEGFGLQGLESIAAGTLVLASDIAVFKEIYADNVLYFNPYDFSSIVGSMKEALEMKPSVRIEIIKKGREFIKKYSWAKMAQQTLKVYEDCYRLRQGK